MHSAVTPPLTSKLSAKIEDLRSWLPIVHKTEDNNLIATHLLFPLNGPSNALQRVLATMIRSLSPSMGKKLLFDTVLHVESTLLEVNNNYYAKLQSLVANPKSKSTSKESLIPLEKLCALQLRRLNDYAEAKDTSQRGL